MIKLEKIIIRIAHKVNWIAALSIILMMLLTTADVVFRIFRYSIPGTFELVGFFSAFAISFSLGYTSLEKGHISVDFFMQRFPERFRNIIKSINSIIALVFFGVLTWQTLLYALHLKKVGEVSLTLQIPIYPVVMGLSLGCFLLCFVLFVETMRILRGVDVE